MIDPITAGGATSALAELTGEMAGLTLAQAWDDQGFKDPVQAGYGVDFGVNISNIGSKRPAVSGDTKDSIADSQEVDPVDAWHEYIENDVSKNVSKTTGGIVDGSNVKSMPYSLLETHPEVGVDVVKAVMPIAVPLERAYVAIAQVLGVSMDAAQMDLETKQKFANSITSGTDLIYDAARGLVKAWWDGVSVLFPRKAVEAVEDMMEEEGIGGQPGYCDISWNGYIYHNIPYGHFHSSYTVSGTQRWSDFTGRFIISVSQRSYHLITQRGDQILQKTYTNPEGTYVTGGNYSVSYGGVTYQYSDYSGNKVSGYGYATEPDWDSIGTRTDEEIAAFLAGTVSQSGFYPQGTASSLANSYTAASLPSAGGIATSAGDTEDVVPINLPLDPTNTIDSTIDPTSPTPDDEIDELPLPPIPLPIPDTNPSNPDVPLVDSSVVNTALIDELVEELANTLDPQPAQSSGLIPVPVLPGVPDGQGGSTYPSIVPASGSGLVHVYNPTPAEFVSFGSWLWVTYADASIDKIWNNPFDGIIGAFELYATPQTDGSDNIRSGFLVCPTTAALVRQRYTEIDCGTVIVPEFYGNYLDYSPYSQAYIYLPFIGINEVSIDDIAGHAINIRYRIDAYNGSCIAMIYVAKDGYRNLCYQFAGNCAVEVPMAGGSQAAIKAGVMQAEAYSRAGIANAALSGASAIGAGLATGGLAGGIMGGLSMLGGVAGAWYSGQRSIDAARVANKSTVQHSGQFGASHGAMGLKVPHIMVRNPIQVKVTNYNYDYGFPAHKRVIVGGCTGYLRVREVNVVSAHATDAEKAEIEAALKTGVYIS